MQSDTTSGASQQRAAHEPASGDLTSARRAARRRIMPHTEFAKVLRRAGYPVAQAQSILRRLPDPIDFDRDGEALFERGVSLDQLLDARGGSP